MAALGFLSFFVALGLGVVLVAMRGGPRGVRDTLEAGSRQPLRVVEFMVAGAIALFGLVVPVAVLLSDQASAGPSGSTLNEKLAQGRKLFARNCSQCHQLQDANAIGRVGPDLDQLRPKSPLVLDAIAMGRARGQGQMPAQLLDGQDAKDVASYIDKVAGR